MLIPCIDLQGGKAVQLVHGRRRALAVPDVTGLVVKFNKYAWLHVIDLDAAMARGDNSETVRELCRVAKPGMKVRVGGGIRTVARAEEVKRWGAQQIIVGSSAFKKDKVNTEFLQRLSGRVNRESVFVALDTAKGRILVNGWRTKLRLRPADVLGQLEPFCAGFLCTDVDREGTMGGANLEWFARLRSLTRHPIVAAGGISTRREIKALEKMGMDAAVGMALYKGRIR